MDWTGAAISLFATILTVANSIYGDNKQVRVRISILAMLLGVLGFVASGFRILLVTEDRQLSKIKVMQRLDEITAVNSLDSPKNLQAELARLRADIGENKEVEGNAMYLEVWLTKKKIYDILQKIDWDIINTQNSGSIMSMLKQDLNASLQGANELKEAVGLLKMTSLERKEEDKEMLLMLQRELKNNQEFYLEQLAKHTAGTREWCNTKLGTSHKADKLSTKEAKKETKKKALKGAKGAAAKKTLEVD